MNCFKVKTYSDRSLDGEIVKEFCHESLEMAWLEAYRFCADYLDKTVGAGKWAYKSLSGTDENFHKSGQFQEVPLRNGSSVPIAIEKVIE